MCFTLRPGQLLLPGRDLNPRLPVISPPMGATDEMGAGCSPETSKEEGRPVGRPSYLKLSAIQQFGTGLKGPSKVPKNQSRAGLPYCLVLPKLRPFVIWPNSKAHLP